MLITVYTWVLLRPAYILTTLLSSAFTGSSLADQIPVYEMGSIGRFFCSRLNTWIQIWCLWWGYNAGNEKYVSRPTGGAACIVLGWIFSSTIFKTKKSNEMSAVTHRGRDFGPALGISRTADHPQLTGNSKYAAICWFHRIRLRRRWLINVIESFASCESYFNSHSSRIPSQLTVGLAGRILENEETVGQIELNFDKVSQTVIKVPERRFGSLRNWPRKCTDILNCAGYLELII